jgi:hypothetical protein
MIAGYDGLNRTADSTVSFSGRRQLKEFFGSNGLKRKLILWMSRFYLLRQNSFDRKSGSYI